MERNEGIKRRKNAQEELDGTKKRSGPKGHGRIVLDPTEAP